MKLSSNNSWEQMQAYRHMSFEEKWRISSEMTEALRKKDAAAIRERHPEYSKAQVKYVEFRLRLGDDLFETAFPAEDSLKCTDCEALRAMYFETT